MVDKRNKSNFFQGKEFKTLWWIILIILCGVYTCLRIYGKIGKHDTLDTVVMATGVILALFPLISEVSFLGLSVKKEITDLKADVKDELLSIRSELISVRMSNSQSMNPTINIGLPSKEKIEEEIRKPNKISNNGDFSNEEYEEFINDMNEDIEYLKDVKYFLEKKIKRLIDKEYKKLRVGTAVTDIIYGPRPTREREKGESEYNYYYRRAEWILINKEPLSTYVLNMLSICNRAIEEKRISKEYVLYVKKVKQEVFNQLDEVISNM